MRQVGGIPRTSYCTGLTGFDGVVDSDSASGLMS